MKGWRGAGRRRRAGRRRTRATPETARRRPVTPLRRPPPPPPAARGRLRPRRWRTGSAGWAWCSGSATAHSPSSGCPPRPGPPRPGRPLLTPIRVWSPRVRGVRRRPGAPCVRAGTGEGREEGVGRVFGCARRGPLADKKPDGFILGGGGGLGRWWGGAGLPQLAPGGPADATGKLEIGDVVLKVSSAVASLSRRSPAARPRRWRLGLLRTAPLRAPTRVSPGRLPPSLLASWGSHPYLLIAARPGRLPGRLCREGKSARELGVGGAAPPAT